MQSKYPWESRTVVINAILGIVAAVALFLPAANVVAVFIANHAAQIAMGWSVLNIILRAITKDAIVLTD